MRASALLFWGKVSLAFLLRSGKTTAFLSIMVISAVATLIFLSALTVGVHDAMLRNTVGLFSGHISGYDISDSVPEKDLRGEGTAAVLKRKFIPGLLQKDGALRPLTLCFLDTEKERAVTAFHKKIGRGRYPHMGSKEILLSKTIARDLHAEIGDSLKFGTTPGNDPVTFTVCGIYETSLNALDWKTAFAPLDQAPASSVTWTAAIFLDPGVLTRGALAALRNSRGEKIVFDSWETTMPDLRQLIDLEYVSMAIVIFLVFGVVAIGISCSFIIFIVRNIREYGIMKAMGVTNGELMLLIVIKVLLMNVAACLAGLILGSLCVGIVKSMGGIDISAFTSHNQYFSVSGVIVPRLTAFSLCTPPATALLFSLLASLWPAVLLARKKAAEILRSL